MDVRDIRPGRRELLAGVAALIAASGTGGPGWASDRFSNAPSRLLTDAQWKARLPGFSYQVLRHEGTEPPGASPLLAEHRKGVFSCLGCGLPLFQSAWKFDSGTGWPSFYTSIDGAVATKTDTGFGMVRTEYHCAQCLGHQGHVFKDGPKPTGLRYCNNGAALRFSPA